MKNKVVRCKHILSPFGYMCGNVIGIIENGKTLVITKQGRIITIQLSNEIPVTVRCECCCGFTKIYAEE